MHTRQNRNFRYYKCIRSNKNITYILYITYVDTRLKIMLLIHQTILSILRKRLDTLFITHTYTRVGTCSPVDLCFFFFFSFVDSNNTNQTMCRLRVIYFDIICQNLYRVSEKCDLDPISHDYWESTRIFLDTSPVRWNAFPIDWFEIIRWLIMFRQLLWAMIVLLYANVDSSPRVVTAGGVRLCRRCGKIWR